MPARPDHWRRRHDAFLIGDHNAFLSTLATGGSANDAIFGGDGADDLHGDNFADGDGIDSGNGRDGCHGGAGTDTAARCERVTAVP